MILTCSPRSIPCLLPPNPLRIARINRKASAFSTHSWASTPTIPDFFQAPEFDRNLGGHSQHERIVTKSGESCASAAYTLVEDTYMRVRCWLPVVLSCCALAACFTLNAYGQTEAATVRGSVTDQSGAQVATATVRLVDIDHGTGSQVVTGNSGFYNFASVAPG